VRLHQDFELLLELIVVLARRAGTQVHANLAYLNLRQLTVQEVCSRAIVSLQFISCGKVTPRLP
jgi:hypothetical protein